MIKMTAMLTLFRWSCFAIRCQEVPNPLNYPAARDQLAAYSCGASVELRYLNFLVPKLMGNLLKAQTYQARTSLRRALANPSSA